MSAKVYTEHYQKIDDYWRFNVYVETGDMSFISLGWEYRKGRLMAPYERIKGKCYTMVRVSKRIAKAVYKSAIREIGQLEGREIPFDDTLWKAPTIGQSSFKHAFPKYYAHYYGPHRKADADAPVYEDNPAMTIPTGGSKLVQ
jgi:hypothetical protein